MPEPLHPPYNVTQPRTLVRWLDINSQNGPLTRTRYFIDIPPTMLNQATGFQYAVIVGAYNYIAPAQFSITDFSMLAQGLPCTICISWIVSPGIVNRYILSQGTMALIFPTLPLYTNQLIGRKFSIEYWSNDNPLGLVMPDIQLLTSILYTVDYRWALDIPIEPIGALQVNFQSPNLNLPFVFNAAPLPPLPANALFDNQGFAITDNQGNLITTP